MRVLILAFDFPPFVSVGALRPFSWYRYFREFGIDPVVVTRQWVMRRGDYLDYVSAGFSGELVLEAGEYGTVLKTPYTPNLSNRLLLRYGERKHRTFRRLVTAFYEIAQFFLPLGPRYGLYSAARDYLEANEVDVIVATGEPFVLFHYAANLSREFGIPWVADYRDAWSRDSRRGASVVGRLNSYLERKLLRTAHSFTTVSSFVARHILEVVPGKEFQLVLNGFDESCVEAGRNIAPSSQDLVVGFAGTIYPWHPLESFLDACVELIDSGGLSRLQLEFFGVTGVERLERALASRPLLGPRVRVYPRMNSAELSQNLARSSVLLLFNDYSVMGTKIFTYLGLRRKILLLYERDAQALELKKEHFSLDEVGSESDSLQADLVRATSSGVVVRDANSLKIALRLLHEEFESHGRVRCESSGYQDYARRNQAQRMAEWLHRVRSQNGDSAAQ